MLFAFVVGISVRVFSWFVILFGLWIWFPFVVFVFDCLAGILLRLVSCVRCRFVGVGLRFPVVCWLIVLLFVICDCVLMCLFCSLYV